mmetsp:Transcript_111841/g.194158  ORF Transcript_111841/g.194158 Transcript_111841/m.194158 type:complete len:141 (-) Transcript_111841:4267-4689(-)
MHDHVHRVMWVPGGAKCSAMGSGKTEPHPEPLGTDGGRQMAAVHRLFPHFPEHSGRPSGHMQAMKLPTPNKMMHGKPFGRVMLFVVLHYLDQLSSGGVAFSVLAWFCHSTDIVDTRRGALPDAKKEGGKVFGSDFWQPVI